MILAEVSKQIEYSELYDYFVIGFPLILQLILTYIVYREHKENKVFKLFVIIGIIYTLACGVLVLYDIYFTGPNALFTEMGALFGVQIWYQLILALILFICLLANKVNPKVAKESILMPLISIGLFFLGAILGQIEMSLYFLLSIPAILSVFNPVLLYILSYTAKGKLYEIEEQKDYFSFIKESIAKLKKKYNKT